MNNSYLNFITQPTPQSEPLNEKQVKNNAGGYVYSISPLQQLTRFLILGSAGGTYYQSERDLTKENVNNIIKCINENPKESLEIILDASLKGRAPKNSAAIFALALACKHLKAPIAEYNAITQVCRTGTHLFEFCSYIQALEKGWSGGLRRGVSAFYQKEDLALQLVKYRQRNGWTHRDVLRLCHAASPENNQLLRWAVGKLENPENKLIEGFIKIQDPKATEKDVIKLIEEYHLPWEAVPTQHLKSVAVWNALLPHLPYTATLRNLGRLSSLGVLIKEFSQSTDLVLSRLTNPEMIKKARVHPVSLLIARGVYGRGRGDKGSLTWTPVSRIKDAIEEAFYLAFENYVPTGKRMLLALDVSGSMSSIMDCGISCCEAATAMAMLYLKKEPKVIVRGFAGNFIDLDIGKSDSLTTAMAKAQRNNFGTTDCSLPMAWALKNKEEIDVFAVFTDNETYAGKVHPSVELQVYRVTMDINAKLAVFGMTTTGFTIADPDDLGMLDLVGFDASAPVALRAFIQGYQETISNPVFDSILAQRTPTD